MPRKNTVKLNIEGGYYHIFNRGIESRSIFVDELDYGKFLEYLRSSLIEPASHESLLVNFKVKGSVYKGIPRQPKNFSSDIELVAYCLMPNHFHLLIKQKRVGSMKSFMQSLITRYSMYFNKKQKRMGSLFQGIYKAVLVEDDAYLLHLSRYIHTRPSKLTKVTSSGLVNYPYSSYSDYLRKKKAETKQDKSKKLSEQQDKDTKVTKEIVDTIQASKSDWLKTDKVLDFFNNPALAGLRTDNTYKSFVENKQINSKETLGGLTLDT